MRRKYATGPPEKRFWSYVDKTSAGCWEWKGGRRTSEGYGGFGITSKRVVLAHRFSFESMFGPIPEGFLVCHHCDNPPCVRPDHLFLGTKADNAHDRDSKGRCFRSTNRKLTESQACAILADTRPRPLLAQVYGVSVAAIADIRGRRTWAHLSKETGNA